MQKSVTKVRSYSIRLRDLDIEVIAQNVKNTKTNPTRVDYQALSRIATHISDHFGPSPGPVLTAGRTSLYAARHLPAALLLWICQRQLNMLEVTSSKTHTENIGGLL